MDWKDFQLALSRLLRKEQPAHSQIDPYKWAQEFAKQNPVNKGRVRVVNEPFTMGDLLRDFKRVREEAVDI